ncbi:15-hydroxyprostaglandin dehydrogenase [NAD(+)]-like isoform X1 [Macrobrachium rosenbergii]|uniref:15-hydroxyprostaglandin dehydrogenase [NAD(+)]-like isoform X1 n=2 Tax=Macrobrachium rosenbergii TaxID=79674 RepID=UPI0034D67BF0
MSSQQKIDVEYQRRVDTMPIIGSVALITGAARGLGRSFAQALLARGAKVCVTDINEEQGKVAETELQAEHGANNVMFVKCDVTKDEDFRNAWSKATDTLGTVGLLINNAGIGNEKNWQLTVDVNLGGCMRGTLLALEKMGADKGGAGGTVVNVSSIAGLKVVPFGPTYATTKHAIVGLSRSLGHDFHYAYTKVKVQCLCPSFVQTDLIVDSKKTAFSPQCAAVLEKIGGTLKYMTAETVANGLVQLIEESRNGGCMVVEADKDPYYVDPPVQS